MKVFQFRPYPTAIQARQAHAGAVSNATATRWITGAILGSALLMYLIV